MPKEDQSTEQSREDLQAASALLDEDSPDEPMDAANDQAKVVPPVPVAKIPPKIHAIRPAAATRHPTLDGPLDPGWGTTRPTLRRRGPSVPAYLVLLCLRPEQWAQAARYKLQLTVTALVMAMLLVAVGVGIRAGGAVVPAAQAFAQSYDREHPELTYAHGKLSVTNEAEASAPGKFWPKFLFNGLPVVVDPTGKSSLQGVAGEPAIMIDQKALRVRGTGEGYESVMPLSKMEELAKDFGWSGGEFKINSATLSAAVAQHGGSLAVGIGLGAGLTEVLGTALWAVITAFLVIPVVQLVAYRLAMPRRIAFRVSLAVIVPLVVLDGALKMTGFSVAQVLTGDKVVVFWCACAAALAAWAGWMANAEFAPKTSRGRSHE